jgi:2-dehydropantoate 2-reductase
MEDYLNKAGFQVVVSPDTEALMWDKLYMNSLLNMPTAITRISVEAAVRNKDLPVLLRKMGDEVCAVANAKGIPMDSEKYWQTTIVPIQKMEGGDHYTSAAQDARKKRKLEADFLNGAIVKEGRKYGIPTPYNEAVWLIARTIHNTFDIQF